MRLLVVEDDVKIASYLKNGLSQAGYIVDVAEDGENGLAHVASREYSAMIVDLMLPGISGEELIQKTRDEGNTTPALILSAKQSVDERVQGLRIGADDYITKPFSFSELLERVRAAQRRSEYGSSNGNATLTAGDVVLDLTGRRLYRNGTLIDLKPRELSLMELLMRNKGNVVPKAVILEKLWKFDFDPQTNVVDVLVHRVRKKVDEPFTYPVIETVRGVGYAVRDAS